MLRETDILSFCNDFRSYKNVFLDINTLSETDADSICVVINSSLQQNQQEVSQSARPTIANGFLAADVAVSYTQVMSTVETAMTDKNTGTDVIKKKIWIIQK